MVERAFANSLRGSSGLHMVQIQAYPLARRCMSLGFSYSMSKHKNEMFVLEKKIKLCLVIETNSGRSVSSIKEEKKETCEIKRKQSRKE